MIVQLNQVTLAAACRVKLMERRISMRRASELIGASYISLNRFMHGEGGSVSMVLSICDLLDLDFNAFIFRDGRKKDYIMV